MQLSLNISNLYVNILKRLSGKNPKVYQIHLRTSNEHRILLGTMLYTVFTVSGQCNIPVHIKWVW